MTNTKRAHAAVGYIRMSTDKQEESPEQQRAEILKLAKKYGYRVIRWYEDHAISGAKTLKRKQFIQMISDAEQQGDFRAILCWDQDRFGRFDSIEAGEWISPLRRAGVELICVVQGRINWDDFAGRMIYQITQEGKHRYLVDLSRNSLRGMIHYAKNGNLLGMPTPYGYDRVYFDESGKEMCRIQRGERFRKPRAWSAQLMPEQTRGEVETIRWLFKTFAREDRSARSLAVGLNGQKVPSPSGGEWDFSHIKNLLRHPVYIGTLAYGRRTAGLYHGVGADGELLEAKQERGDMDGYAPIMIPNNHEALIDETTFAVVQERLRARSKVSGGRFRRYLLSGILRCGHCGSIMVGGSQGKGRYQYYKCKRSRVSGTCNNYAVRTTLIEEALIEHFRIAWLSKNGQKALRKAITRVAAKQADDRPNRIASLQQRLETLETQIAKGRKNLLLVDPDDVPDLKQILAGWKDERTEIEHQLAEEEQPAESDPDTDPDAVIEELHYLEEHLASNESLTARAAFSRVFKSVTLYWNHGEGRYRELDRAEVEPQHPFALTENTRMDARVPHVAKPVQAPLGRNATNRFSSVVSLGPSIRSMQ